MIKKLIATSAVLLITGCSMMGTTEYELEPVVKADGSVICCKATVFNSKDYDSLKFKFKIARDGTIEAMLGEKGINASDPATIGAENNGKMLDVINQLIPKVTN